LSLSGTLQVYRENMSMTFKRYLNLSLSFERGIKSGKSISHISSIFVTIYGLRGNVLRTGLCKEYVFWPDNHYSTSLFWFYWPLIILLLTHTLLQVWDLINFTQRHYYC